MKSFIKKQPYNPQKAFDDSSFSSEVSNISMERSLEIERLMMPFFEKEFDKLKKLKSEIYSTESKIVL